MKKTLILIIISFFFLANANAQDLKVISATKQDWSGGVEGNYGTNYTIVIGPVSKKIELDSLYTNILGIKLIPGSNVNIDTVQKAYIIYVRVMHTEEDLQYLDRQPPVIVSDRFNGGGLILYRFKRKHYSLVVKELQVLEPLAYP